MSGRPPALASRASGLPGGRSLPAVVVALAGLVSVAPAGASSQASPTLRAIVETLASDGMGGRGAGSAQLDSAGVLVQGWLEDAGLSPGYRGEWYQAFPGAAGESLFNVVGRVSGTGDEWIAVGAHYDGLGIGLPGTEHFGQVLNGADDNASGVAALVAVARRLAREEDLERSVYVVAFSGEETGALGSQAFVADPPAPLARAAAMLNLDTVGRIENERLIVFGTETAEEFRAILKGVNYGFGFDLAGNSEGAGASDHASFFAKGVPVLHFFSGARSGYHGPGDDTRFLNYEGIARVAAFVGETAAYLAARAVPLTFHSAGAEHLVARGPGREAGRRRVSFGSIPDFSRESGGILLSGVTPGGPAEAAGLRAGDVLVAMDGDALDTIYDFQGALSARQPGDVVVVTYERNGETRETQVKLRERKR